MFFRSFCNAPLIVVKALFKLPENMRLTRKKRETFITFLRRCKKSVKKLGLTLSFTINILMLVCERNRLTRGVSRTPSKHVRWRILQSSLS